MNKFKKNKGITLVALIITIIILLILAVVSISAVKGDGIVSHAKNARTEYQQAQENESTILDSYLKELDDAAKGERLTTQQAVAAGLKVGDYVEYPVQYSNVGTNVDTSTGEASYYPADSYAGWRVLSIEGEGENSYIRLVSAGVPLNYYHDTNSSTTVTNLTTGFFNTQISSTLTPYNFYSCGFKDASGNAVTSIDGVKTLFTNEYTQMEGTIPKVQSITNADLEPILDSETTDETGNDLLAIQCKSPESSGYARSWLASAGGGKNIMYLYGEASTGLSSSSVMRNPPCGFSEN